MRPEGVWMIVLVGWTAGLIAWTEIVNYRAKKISWLIEQEVRRRFPRRRPRPRPQSNVQVRAPHPSMHASHVGDEAEAWLRDRSR